MTKIKGLRASANLTQAQLADALGVARSAVAMWEAVGSFPPSRVLPRLAKVLGVPIGELFAEDEDDKEGGIVDN